MKNATTFGGWLRQSRKDRGITLDELADRISCSRVTLIKIEAGERRPSRQLAELLAEQFNIPDDEREAFVIFARMGDPSHRAEPSTAGDADVATRAPWRTTRRHLTNLPSVLTPLVGREQEAGAVHDLLLRPKVRLLTLTGPPGIGKTRLGLQVASGLLEDGPFEDGVFFVELAPIREPDLVLPTVARTLGLQETPSQTIEETLIDFVRQRRLLLVLDNFEQVLDAAPEVVKMLEAGPWSKALVTSREALHVRGERHFPVPPLRLPDLTQLPPADVVKGYSAVELFVERAQAAAPDFALAAANSREVAEVCIGLEGLPLAIELAAARAAHLSPLQMREALQNRLKLLTRGPRDLPTRHRTIEAAIGWSYDLLSEGEQKLFRRLGVFVGGRDLDAVEAVCNAGGDTVTGSVQTLGIETLDGLESLVNKNLLRRESLDRYRSGEARYVMLEMVREFALDRLAEHNESGAVRDLHARYFLHLAEEAEPDLRGPRQVAWLDRLDMEHDNIRAALRWSLESGAAEVGLRLVGTLRWFWTQRSHFTEGLQWARAVLAMPGAQEHTRFRAKALWSAGVLAWVQGDPEARTFLEESVLIWREVGDKSGLGHALLVLGMAVLQQGQPEAALSIQKECVAVFRSAGDKSGLLLALSAQSTALQALEDAGASNYHAGYEEQRAWLEEAIKLAREAEDLWGLALVLRGLSWIAMRQGDYAAARPLLQESLALHWEVGTKHEAAATLGDLGQLAQLEGDLEAALEFCERSLDAYGELADKPGLVNSMAAIGGVALRMGSIPRAVEVLTTALEMAKELGSLRYSIVTLDALGWLMVGLGMPARAALLLSAVEAHYKTHPFLRPIAARIESERYLESAHAQVDEATWHDARSKGEAMSMDEALQLASESLEVGNV